MMTNNGIYNNLLSQFERVYKHNRQGSIRTKHRYREAFIRFITFLAETFRLMKLSNISDKHLRSYVDDLLDRGLEISYIKVELSAIRFWCDQIPGFKHQLPSNKELGLERRQYGKTDRTWSDREFDRAVELAVEKGLEGHVAALTLARFAGLRLHEIYRLDTRTAELSLQTGEITVIGKNGLRRQVPTTPEINTELRKLLDVTPRGCKLFVGRDTKTHIAMRKFEDFLYYNRAKIQDPGSTRPLVAHGLRHVFAVEKYQEFIGQGMSPKAARHAVARLLGHGRDEITRVYLASLDNQEGGEANGR